MVKVPVVCAGRRVACPTGPGRTVPTVSTVAELCERLERLETRVAENRRVIESQQRTIGCQQRMLRELADVYDLFESTVIETATPDLPYPGQSRPVLRLLR
jgi:uncharacterized coiled-coil protein SlyX